ncbi:MAG: hypothetical protein KDD60_03195 [Bdellovibrionales bacterium]|nr:hypothetical protein [Bdellovibrionales bacterium]
MSRAFTPGLLAVASTPIMRKRELPVPGEILVNIGDRIQASDEVARAELPGELYILRLPERMGLEPFEVLEGLKVKPKDVVSAGDLICEQRILFGLLSTSFRAPEGGTIEFIAEQTGHVGLRLPPNTLSLNAYISGSVSAIEPGKSVTLSAEHAFIQGIFGVGGERQGTLNILNIDPGQEVTPEILQNVEPHSICVGGARPTLESLHYARDKGIAGIVCGSIDDQVLSAFLGYELGIALTGDEDIPFTLIITEGFGCLPISERVGRALEGLQGNSASINGKTQVRAGAVRPELIVSNAAGDKTHDKSTLTADSLTLKIGAHVRLIRVPYFGEFAEVIELPIQEEVISTGARTRVLRAKLASGEVVTIPRANVELVL